MPGKWTRRVALAAAVLAVGLLPLAGAGPAAAASGDTLSVKAARKLAHELEAKQREQRSLVFQQLGKAARKSSTRIDFPYRDRSTKDVLCTATIVVTQRGTVQTGRHRSADLRDIHCHGIPSEILAYEDATSALRQWVKSHRQDVQDSLDRYDQALPACDRVAVPKERRSQVNLLIREAQVAAFYRPLRARLDQFVTALHDVNGQDPTMLRGIKAWDRTLVLVDQLPPATAHPCRAIKQWADNGFTDQTAPANFDELKVIRQQLRAQSDILDESAAYLDDQGVLRKVAPVFAPSGILALVDPKRSL
jgi:hypothetical protein